MISPKDLKVGTILRYKTEQVDYYGIVVQPRDEYATTHTVLRWINHSAWEIHEDVKYNLSDLEHGKNWSIITED